jgi:hypothetical protein
VIHRKHKDVSANAARAGKKTMRGGESDSARPAVKGKQGSAGETVSLSVGPAPREKQACH